MPDRLVSEADRLPVVEVADVLGEEGLAAAGDGDRVLEIGAGRDHARAVLAEIDRVGNEAARAPEIGRRADDDAHDRIVGPDHDRAPVRDDEVGDAPKAVNMPVHSGETGTRILKPFRSSGVLIGLVPEVIWR